MALSVKQVALFTRLVPMVRDNEINPWGDFEHALQVSVRVQGPAYSAAPPSVPGASVFFKVCKHTGALATMTEAEFEKSCIAAHLSTAPTKTFYADV